MLAIVSTECEGCAIFLRIVGGEPCLDGPGDNLAFEQTRMTICLSRSITIPCRSPVGPSRPVRRQDSSMVQSPIPMMSKYVAQSGMMCVPT